MTWAPRRRPASACRSAATHAASVCPSVPSSRLARPRSPTSDPRPRSSASSYRTLLATRRRGNRHQGNRRPATAAGRCIGRRRTSRVGTRSISRCWRPEGRRPLSSCTIFLVDVSCCRRPPRRSQVFTPLSRFSPAVAAVASSYRLIWWSRLSSRPGCVYVSTCADSNY